MIIDASVWVSSLLIDDIHHERSFTWFERALLSEQSLVIPSIALAEIAGAVSRRRDSGAEGHAALQKVLAAPGLRVMVIDLDLARLSAQIAARHHLRGADAVYAATALRANLPLLSWDREMQERLGGSIQVLHP